MPVLLRLFILTAAVAVCIALSSTHAWAVKVCGDDVDGVRIACACGDVAISDVTLRPNDPIVREKCMHDGLIVSADSQAEAITINLSSQVLVGSGYGYGIFVERGGSDGAVIIGGKTGRMAQIIGFGRGIYAPKPRAISRLEAVSVLASTDDGIRLNANGTVVIDVHTSKNGGNGLAMRGTGGRVVDLTSSGNASSGARISSRGAIITGVIEGNDKHGIVVSGSRNDLSGVSVRDNAGIGVAVHGGGQKLKGLTSEFNGKGNVRGLRHAVARR